MNGYIAGGVIGALVGVALFVRAVRGSRWTKSLVVLGSFGLVLGILATAFGLWLASGDRSTIAAQEIAPGVIYERFILHDAVAHLMSFDLSDPCLELTTTKVRPDGSVDAQKTTSWAADVGAVAAINSNYFFPYYGGVPWNDPTPVEGEEVNILGTIKRRDEPPVSASSEYGKVRHRLWVDESGVPQIGLELGDDAVVAVTGRERLLENGQLVGHDSSPYPRTVVGITEGTTTMWWLVVDGKRPGYSVGVTLDEAGRYLRQLGATDAVALDGGGSSTMVVAGDSGVEMLNLTRNQSIPDRERAIANHLGLIQPAGCDPG